MWDASRLATIADTIAASMKIQRIGVARRRVKANTESFVWERRMTELSLSLLA